MRGVLVLLFSGLGMVFGLSGSAASVTLLSANIGNSDLLCTGYGWKLCLSSVEKRVTASIRAIDAEVVLLQEVVPAEYCRAKNERKRGFVCHGFEKRSAEEKEQARRILGPDYTIAVTRGAFEAVGIKKGAGHIQGCPDGALCVVPRLTIPSSCDQGFSVTTVDVEIDGKQYRLINGHPDSISSGCRAAEVAAAFQAALPGGTIMAGDWNLDPYRSKDKSVRVWEQNFTAGNFHYLSGVAERNPPYFTIFLPLLDLPLKTLDHVVSDFAQGACRVLGPSPGTKRLDGRYNLDHRGILCNLEF